MKQISAKLNSYNIGVSIVNSNLEKIALRFVLWSFLVLSLFYLFMLGNTVRNIIERRSFDTEARNISAEVSNLELTYLNMSNSIDLNYSHAKGFTEAKANFATRKSLGFGNIKNTQNDL
jgi:hypothetical protein